eukprot:1782031-Pyramimonas_sp.AAC.1
MGLATCDLQVVADGLACDVSRAERGRAVGAPAGNWTQGEKRGWGAMGVECTLAVVGTGGPVKR